MKIAVVIPYYNFTRSAIVTKNHAAAVEQLRCEPGVDVFTSEAMLPGCDTIGEFTAATESVLWHKEGLINRATAILAADYGAIAWVDSGVLLTPGWADRLRAAFSAGYDVVQPFVGGVWLDDRGNPGPGHTGHVAGVARGLDAHTARPKLSHGMAWAATSAVVRRLPLYDRAIVGGGDTWWVCGATGAECPEALVVRHQSAAQWVHVGRWLARAHAMRLRVGWIDGAYTHLWHADTACRQYELRHGILSEGGYNPAVHTRIGSAGLVEWTDAAPVDMVARVRGYLLGRAHAPPGAVVRWPCRHCGQALAVPGALARHPATCPRCHRVSTAPAR